MVPMFESWRQHPPRDPPCNSYFFILNELLASSQFLISAIFRDFFRGNFFPFPGIVGGDKKWSSPPRPSASFFIFCFFRWPSPRPFLDPPRRFFSFPAVFAVPIPAWHATPPPVPEASSGPPSPACRPFLGDVRSRRPTLSASPPFSREPFPWPPRRVLRR